MSYSKTLAEKRNALLAEAEQITVIANDEKRELTNDEDAKIVSVLDEVRTLDVQIERHVELEKRAIESKEIRKEIGVEFSTTVVKSEPRTYSPEAPTSFLRDAYASQFNNDFQAQGRLARHMSEERVERRDVTSAAFAGLMVPQFLTDLAAPFARAGRVTAELARKHQLPDSGLTLSISKVTTGSAVAAQTEGAAVQETNIDDTKLDITVQTFAGQQNVSRQALERGTMVDSLVMNDLVSAYHSRLNTAVVAELLASAGVAITYTDATPTVAETYPKLLDAVQQVQTAFFQGPNVMIMHPRRLAFFLAATDTTGRPLAVPTQNGAFNAIGVGAGAPQYGNSGYSIAGLPVFTDATISIVQGAGVNQDTIFIGNSQELHLWEQGSGEPMLLRFEQPKAAELDITMIVYGYAAFTANRYANAWAQVNGTGLITPTF